MQKPTALEYIIIKFLFFIAMLLVVRIWYTGTARYLFLVWNLFLAAIPLLITRFFPLPATKLSWRQTILLLVWLLFFPNALYIITDCIHLQTLSAAPKWFDAVLLFSSALVGLLMGFISLYKVEFFLTGFFRGIIVKILSGSIIVAGAFGVYLGRFLRWNSWDVISNPVNLFGEIFSRILFPFEHLHTWAITFILACFYFLVYSFLKSLSRTAVKL